jgi:hypothetical protein
VATEQNQKNGAMKEFALTCGKTSKQGVLAPL